MGNSDVVYAYFSAVRRKDAAAHRKLFAADAELLTSVGTFSGVDAIVGFYRDNAFVERNPLPEPGPLFVREDSIAVEIRIPDNGKVWSAADFFTFRDSKISRLVIYTRPTDAAE